MCVCVVMVAGPTETGCPQEMTPQVPSGAEKVPARQPGDFVQKTDFGPGVFVEDVPKDDAQPNTKVYRSVEPDVGVFCTLFWFCLIFVCVY